MLGLDLGAKRIGVAVSDTSATVATPLVVLIRSAERRRDHEAVRELVVREAAERIVVGLPLSLDGSTGPAARAALEEAEALATVVGVPVETHDERLTTVSAERVLREAGLRAPARRRVIDKVAATVMLQSWLDARRS